MLPVYRWLLRLFPARFRRRFGDDMTTLFTDHLREARVNGAFAMLWLCMRTSLRMPIHAAGEWLAVVRTEPPSPFAQPPRGAVMPAVISDFKAAARSLLRRPGFALSAGSMLAVGLGFNTALFAVVHAVVLKPLPFADPARIVMLWTGRNPDGTGSVNSYPDFLDWKAQSTSFEQLAAYNISMANITEAGEPEEIGGATVSPEFFPVLGAQAMLGRTLEAADARVPLDRARPVVIAHSLWTRRFGSDPSIVGRTIVLNDRRRLVVGVLTESFAQPEPFWGKTAEFWTPLNVTASMEQQRAFRYLRVIGRLKQGTTISTARSEMDGIGRRLMATYPALNSSSVVVADLHDELVGDTGPLLWMFLGAVSLVMLLAVANIVNLLLARANGRSAEFSIRAALGASRRRLISQLVCESTLIGLIGGVTGLGFAQASIMLLERYGAVSAPGIESTALDGPVLLFAAVMSALTGALCGVMPALRVARAKLVGSSVSEMRGSRGLAATRARRWLVAAEMALAVPLLVGAGLLAQTLVSMQRVDPGFDPQHALQFRVSLSSAQYDSSAKQIQFFDDLHQRLRAIPGVTSVGMVSSLPLGGLNNTGGSLEYRRTDGTVASTSVGYRAIAGDYFDTLGIRVVAGRKFNDGGDQNAIIINEAAARQMWGNENALGRLVRLDASGGPDANWLTVVGVTASVRHESLTRGASPETFTPYRQNTWSTMTVTMRGDREPSAFAAEARAVVHALNPRMPVVNLGPVSQFIDGQLARPRFGVMCASVFGAIGLALAMFGTFAVLSLLVSQRTREIGIRMALGADRLRITAMIFGQSLLPALVGCVAGGMLAAWLARLLSSQLFGVSAQDPRTFAIAVGTLIAAAGVASWWPTRRATKINPIVALRQE